MVILDVAPVPSGEVATGEGPWQGREGGKSSILDSREPLEASLNSVQAQVRVYICESGAQMTRGHGSSKSRCSWCGLCHRVWEFGDLKSLHSYITFTCAVGMGDMAVAVCRDLAISGNREMAQSAMRRGGTEVGCGLWLQVPAPIQAPPLNELCSFGQVTCPQWDTCLLFCKVELMMLRGHGSLKGRETLSEGLLCMRCSRFSKCNLCSRGFCHYTGEEIKPWQNEMNSPSSTARRWWDCWMGRGLH